MRTGRRFGRDCRPDPTNVRTAVDDGDFTRLIEVGHPYLGPDPGSGWMPKGLFVERPFWFPPIDPDHPQHVEWRQACSINEEQQHCFDAATQDHDIEEWMRIGRSCAAFMADYLNSQP